ncbi:hypothetical protein ENBRE01_1191 [Enteropsectra breve]|nr:hypothetical protein ENBRE01_1191 [Enteropsectra breve]
MMKGGILNILLAILSARAEAGNATQMMQQGLVCMPANLAGCNNLPQQTPGNTGPQQQGAPPQTGNTGPQQPGSGPLNPDGTNPCDGNGQGNPQNPNQNQSPNCGPNGNGNGPANQTPNQNQNPNCGPNGNGNPNGFGGPGPVQPCQPTSNPYNPYGNNLYNPYGNPNAQPLNYLPPQNQQDLDCERIIAHYNQTGGYNPYCPPRPNGNQQGPQAPGAPGNQNQGAPGNQTSGLPPCPDYQTACQQGANPANQQGANPANQQGNNGAPPGSQGPCPPGNPAAMTNIGPTPDYQTACQPGNQGNPANPTNPTNPEPSPPYQSVVVSQPQNNPNNPCPQGVSATAVPGPNQGSNLVAAAFNPNGDAGCGNSMAVVSALGFEFPVNQYTMVAKNSCEAGKLDDNLAGCPQITN